MMKFLALAALVLLTACGGGDDDEPRDASVNPPACGQGACR